uniref:FAS1 domain-containing protein n=1 Tax=Aegilops tauschii subsp. strangulata TaxID=200361 RepID=A0A453B2E1_AEGTS
MAAPFLLLLLLVVSGGAAAGGDGEAGLPRLEFRGIDGSVHGHASDAPEERAFTDVISTGGACDHFARLVAETGNASQLFWERAAGAGGLTVFCPEDKALAEFEPKFRGLGADDRLAVLLYHGAATTYGRKLFQSFDWVSVSSLATDAATNKSHAINVRDDGDTVWLWPSSRSGAGARVTKTVSEEAPLAVYVVDAVLLPNHLRQKLDGGDEPAAACEPSGGYFGWLHCCIPVWQVIAMAVASIAGFLTGFLLHDAVDKMNNKANLSG